MSKTTQVTITEDDVKQLLNKHLLLKDKEDFVNLLCGHICKEPFAMSQIFKGLLGIMPSLKYKKGEWVYVNIENLPVWRYEKIATLKLEGVKDNFIPCMITKTDIFKESCYDIKFFAIKSGESIILEQDYSISEDFIKEKVETIETILDSLEYNTVEKILKSNDPSF